MLPRSHSPRRAALSLGALALACLVTTIASAQAPSAADASNEAAVAQMPAQLDGYEVVTPTPDPTATTPNPVQTPPADPFAGSPPDGAIPSSFVAALGPPEERARAAPPPFTWTDRFRLSAGLGAGALLTLGGGLRRVSADAQGTELVVFDQAERLQPALSASATAVYGLTLAAELFARIDLVIVPGTLDARGTYSVDRSASPSSALADEVALGAAWWMSSTLSIGVRLRPTRTNGVYLAFAGRFGFGAVLATLDLWQCNATDVCSARDAPPPRAPDRRAHRSMAEPLYGGELGVGTTLGADASWDLGLRVAADNLSISALVMLERRLL